jgi:hypothetical protein
MDRRNLNKVGCKGYNIDNKEIVRLYLVDNLTMKEIGEKFNISRWTVLDRLRKLGIRKNMRHFVNHDSFNKFTKESCYWAGFIAADGNVSKNMIHVELQYSDYRHLEKLCRFVNRDTMLWERSRLRGIKTFKYVTMSIVSNKIVKDVAEKFNIVPNKTFVLQPPNIPDNMINHYIRGYIDGDGSIGWHKHSNKPRIHIVSGSKYIIKWLKSIIEKENITGNPKIKCLGNKHNLEYSGLQTYSILDWLYAGSTEQTRLDRKYERYKKYKLQECTKK